MDDMHDQHETPTSDAARGVGHYLTGTLAAADLAVRLRTWLTKRLAADGQGADDLQPGDLEQAGKVLDPGREAYTAMLGRDEGRDADSRTALLAWVSAQPHREDDSEAELVAGRAEARLRELHPDAMTRYDALRDGLSPVEAMREVVPLIVVEQQHTAAREAFAPMLDPAVALSADSRQALAAWSAALPLADALPDAAFAATVAEDRLRELHTDAMDRYDSLRDSHTPADALAEVSPLIDPSLHTSTPDGRAAAGTTATSTVPDALRPPEDRYAAVVREILQGDLADQVLHDKAWPALAGSLAKAEQLGATPADLLASAAGQRELSSAKSVAHVLAFRVEQHQVPTHPGPPRIPTAADLVASSYPSPLSAARPGSAPGAPDLAVLGAALELGREADIELQTAQAGAVDDVTTSHVDERREGRNDAQPHVRHAAADPSTASALLARAGISRATTAAGAPATAARSYPTPIEEVSASQAAPKTAAAPAARTATRKAPSAGRRR
jgi:hypothetical protein